MLYSLLVSCICASPQLFALKTLMAAVRVAAPTALQAHNIGVGKALTSYPSFKEQLQEKYTYKEDNVVVDGWYNLACHHSLCPSTAL
jgi:hypothetical protein